MLGGWGNGSSVSNAGSNGRYWSSTYYSTTYAYRLYFLSSGVHSQEPGDKYYGYAVRCVKKSEWKGRVEKRVMKGVPVVSGWGLS